MEFLGKDEKVKRIIEMSQKIEMIQKGEISQKNEQKIKRQRYKTQSESCLCR